MAKEQVEIKRKIIKYNNPLNLFLEILQKIRPINSIEKKWKTIVNIENKFIISILEPKRLIIILSKNVEIKPYWETDSYPNSKLDIAGETQAIEWSKS